MVERGVGRSGESRGGKGRSEWWREGLGGNGGGRG